MNNKLIYFDEEFPSYYMNGSRDFQLLARLLTLMLNSGKVEADSLLYLNDALLISDRLLPLLQTKVGFWTNREFTNDELRLVCDVFDLLVRKKGSRDGIVEAIEIFLKTINLSTNFDILIVNKDGFGNNVYEIQIGINSTYRDDTLLREILKYILPTGYILSIFFYDFLHIDDREKETLQYSDYVIVSSESNYRSSMIRGSYYNSNNQAWTTGEIDISDVDNGRRLIQSIDMTTISNSSQKDSSDV